MPDHVTLNWYGDDENLIPNLREAFSATLVPETIFRTIRLGTKYADSLNPDDLFAIGIDDNVLGYARVTSITKGILGVLKEQSEDLERNIGAKNWESVLRDMQRVYGMKQVDLNSVVTIIDFVRVKAAS